MCPNRSFLNVLVTFERSGYPRFVNEVVSELLDKKAVTVDKMGDRLIVKAEREEFKGLMRFPRSLPRCVAAVER